MIKPLLLALGFFIAMPAAVMAQTKAATKEKAPATAKKEDTKKAEPKKPAAAVVSDADKALQEAAAKAAAKLTPTQNAKLLALLNKGDSAAIQVIDGLGEAKAGNVIKKRPYVKVDDVIMVDGIGESTFGNMVAWAKGEQKEAAPAAAKTEEKKPATKADKPATEEKKPATKKTKEDTKETKKKAA